MNKKGNSVNFVVITTTALILIGLAFIVLGKGTAISYSTYDNKVCYEMDKTTNNLIATSLNDCCINIRKSSGCSPYEANIVNEQMFLCNGNVDIIANKNMIKFCGD
jgi:hypothetical protein